MKTNLKEQLKLNFENKNYDEVVKLFTNHNKEFTMLNINQDLEILMDYFQMHEMIAHSLFIKDQTENAFDHLSNLMELIDILKNKNKNNKENLIILKEKENDIYISFIAFCESLKDYKVLERTIYNTFLINIELYEYYVSIFNKELSEVYKENIIKLAIYNCNLNEDFKNFQKIIDVIEKTNNLLNNEYNILTQLKFSHLLIISYKNLNKKEKYVNELKNINELFNFYFNIETILNDNMFKDYYLKYIELMNFISDDKKTKLLNTNQDIFELFLERNNIKEHKLYFKISELINLNEN